MRVITGKHQEIRRVDHLDRLEDGQGLNSPAIRHESRVPPVPSAFWIRKGVRSAIVTAIALVMRNWVDITGSGHFLIYSWVFVFLYNVGPSGHGDSRAFYNAFGAICILFGLSLLAFVATPAMVS